MKLPTYTWRGKTYKTIGGLHRAVLARHPGASLNFDLNSMNVILGRRDTRQTIKYARTFDSDHNSLIASEATAKVPPYCEWCRNPAACAGKGYCPLDPTCGD